MKNHSEVKTATLVLYIILAAFSNVEAQVSKVWSADLGNGKYQNPVINADYSDPDAIRVGEDFYMISSSFNHVPGLPILHSKDLVNWELIGHAIDTLYPAEHYTKVQPGGGAWAPAIRQHNDSFYIYYPDPDFGIYLIKSKNILGPWSKPLLVLAGKGIIDPCPLWDDYGKLYLVHAFAGSRAGIKSILMVKEMNAAGTAVLNNGVIVYDGHAIDATVEGPKFYKRNGFYYVFAPAGGVSTGWQIVLRSKNIYGPYERKIVMAEGNSGINGPHQGAWVNTLKGEDWFLHFQDKGAYGRVVLLERMQWKNDWPVIGADADADGIGEPVLIYTKPKTTTQYKVMTVADDDEFNTVNPGLQWQWQANPQQGWSYHVAEGNMRFYANYQDDSFKNKWFTPSLYLQKFPAEEFVATAKFTFHPAQIGDRFGFMIFGIDYAFLSVIKKEDGNYLSLNTCENADKNISEKEILLEKITGSTIYFRVEVKENAICGFSFSEDGRSYKSVGKTFNAKEGKWVGAKIGFFCSSEKSTNDSGFADVDWIRFTK